jgi:cell division protein FtsI/penicillin-binding protein 2
MSGQSERKQLGRRRFLQSLFGLKADTQDQRRQPTADDPSSFFWCSLENGQVAFPTGAHVPAATAGSIFHVVTAAALMETLPKFKAITYECNGTICLDGKEYRCTCAHGVLDVTHALGVSCEVFFAQSGQSLTSRCLFDYASRFGLDRPAAGYAPKQFPAHPKFSAVEYALGQAPDLVPNALQLLRLVAIVGLTREPPTMHNAAEEASTERSSFSDLAPETWAILKDGLRMNGRTGVPAQLDPEDILGLAVSSTVDHNRQTIIVAGYFPHNAPRYAFSFASPAHLGSAAALIQAKSFLFAAEWP